MEPITLLYSLLPLWGVAIFMFVKNGHQLKNDWKSWFLTLSLTVPILFFPLCAYLDKKRKEKTNTNQTILNQEFKLRIWICISCYVGELATSFILKQMGLSSYGELAITCANICLVILILSCWNAFKPFQENL